MVPSLFIAHGAPTLAIETGEYVDFLKQLAAKYPTPRAIVVFSAHWEAQQQLISGASSHSMIYDFYGFPEEMYRMVYPAQGDPALAKEIQQFFEAEGIPASLDTERGIDHGTWVPLQLVYPEANIPVIALSVNRYLTAEQQYKIGRALAALREKDILVIGSGGTVHNLRRLDWDGTTVASWAKDFDAWLGERIEKWDLDELWQYETLAPYAREAVPTPEHFVPLLLAMGAADDKRTAKKLHQSYQLGSLSLTCWEFGG